MVHHRISPRNIIVENSIFLITMICPHPSNESYFNLIALTTFIPVRFEILHIKSGEIEQNRPWCEDTVAKGLC